MATVIRLARHGRKKRPFYRLVACDNDMKRDGRFLEKLGTVNPLSDPATIEFDQERVKYWLSVGARPSDTASQMIDKIMPGYISDIEDKRKEKIRSKRAARKARAKSKS